MKRKCLLVAILVLTIFTGKVYAKGISISPSTLTAGMNSKYNLKVNFEDGDTTAIIWSSSNPNVVSVNNGILTTYNSGTAIITATDANNNKAICDVTVIKNYIPITNISLNNSIQTIMLNESKQLSINFSPGNASNKNLVYSSSNPDIISISSNGTITGKKVGDSYITILDPEYQSSNKIYLHISVIDKISLKSISIKNSLELIENNSAKLSVTYNPTNATDKKITWKSSDESIATVDGSGNVTAKKAGTTEIRAISNDGGYVATCKVTVTALSKELKSIKLDKTELTLEAGKEDTLKVIYEPDYAENKNVTWESSDKKIATVKDGVITAIKKGTVDITVTSEEGKKTAICKVTVISPPIESISFSLEEQNVYVGTKTTLKTISYPEDSSIDNPIWTSSDETVATVEDGIITAIKPGITIITISNEDGSITASTKITVLEKEPDPLNIEVVGYELGFNKDVLEYTLKIGNEEKLSFNINIDSKKYSIKGNENLKNGSVITITVNDEKKVTYIINIKKKENYTIYFIGIISVLLFLNIIRMIVKNKKKKYN